MEKIAAWLLTEAGRKFVYFSAATASVTFTLSKILPNTFFLDEYKDIIHFYRKGFTLGLTKELTDRFQKALDLSKIPNQDQHLYKPFHVIGFDIYSAGSAYFRYGVIVGIPYNYRYNDFESVDFKHEILVEGERISWGTTESKNYVKSLILSENAQLYAMAREIKLGYTSKFLWESLYTMIPVPLYYFITTQLNERYKLFSKPRGLRIVTYGMVGSLVAMYYFFLKDLTQCYFEKKVDAELVELDKVFVEGGREFYTQLMAKNRALRSLMGKAGESKYTVMGNENYFIRQKRLPLSDRKAFFEETLTQLTY